MTDLPHGIVLNTDEKLEPLDDGFAIIQSAKAYRFGSDAVALAKFAARRVKPDHRVFDLCSGCGVVGILTAVYSGASVDGADLDRQLYDMSVRSCAINDLRRVRFFNADIRLIGERSEWHRRYDVVTCNPPFYKAGTKPRKIAPSASCELTVEFSDVAHAASMLLKPCGEFCLVHTSVRLDEVLCTCLNSDLTPKELEINANGKTFLLRCVKGGNHGLSVVVKEF